MLVLGIVVLSLLALAGAQSCPNEWTSFDGSCYSMGTESLSWADAQEVCRIFDSDLAVIETQKENDFIKRLLADHHPSAKVWIGATDVFNEGHFMWLRTFQDVTFTDWASGEPNHLYGDGSEDCVQMKGDRHWQWNDAACADTNYFLCEMSLGLGGTIG